MGVKNIILFIAKIIVFLQTTKQINRKIYSPEIYIRFFLVFAIFLSHNLHKKRDAKTVVASLFVYRKSMIDYSAEVASGDACV